MKELKFRFDFAKALRKATSFPALQACAEESDKDQKRFGGIDFMEPPATRRVSEVMAVAERFIKGRLNKFLELLPCFSTFAGRLLAIESFVEKHPPKSAIAAVTLIEMIANGQNCICEECHPLAIGISKAIRVMAQPFIKPTDDSTAQELAAMAKLIKGPPDGSNELPPASMKQIVDIANSAKRFAELDNILLVARALPEWETANGLMFYFLERIGITTAEEAEKILASTRVESDGGRELMNETIVQMVKEGPDDLDIAGLLAKTKAFVPTEPELTGISSSILQSMMGPGGKLSDLLSLRRPMILGDRTTPPGKGLSDFLDEIMKNEG